MNRRVKVSGEPKLTGVLWMWCVDYSGVQLQGCCSQSSLNSNGSLPGVVAHRGVPEQRVASWATCFERLLQDSVGVRYFSVRKETLQKMFLLIFFEQKCCKIENIVVWIHIENGPNTECDSASLSQWGVLLIAKFSKENLTVLWWFGALVKNSSWWMQSWFPAGTVIIFHHVFPVSQ